MSTSIRKIINIYDSVPTMEGAGVRLKRVFANRDTSIFDPFLLLDNFGSGEPQDYLKGFPWHPHRGMETITYMIRGEVEHGDNIGNKGIIKSGEVQWMTAGSGIMHQEMPRPFEGDMMGLQLWLNLPKKNKMTAPRYMEITKFPLVEKDDAKIKIIAGNMSGEKNPKHDLFVDIEYLDIDLNGKLLHETKMKTAFVYVYEGSIEISGKKVLSNQCALLSKMGEVAISGKAKFIFVAGDPLNEPVAWGGPIVMNSEEELQAAFEEIDKGTFIK